MPLGWRSETRQIVACTGSALNERVISTSRTNRWCCHRRRLAPHDTGEPHIVNVDVLGEPATSAPGDVRPDDSRVPRPVSPREPSGMEDLTQRMCSRCHHRSHAISPCASERPRHRRRHLPSRNPEGSTDRFEETRTSRPRPTNRSPPISTVQLERSRDADLRAVRDNRRPKRATRTHPLLAPATSGPKPFDHRCSHRARSSRLPRMAHDGHTVHADHRHEGSRHDDG